MCGVVCVRVYIHVCGVVWCVYMCTYMCVHVVWCVCTLVYVCTYMCEVWCVYVCTYMCIISRYVISSTPRPSVLAVLLCISFDFVSSGHSEIGVPLGIKIKLHGVG